MLGGAALFSPPAKPRLFSESEGGKERRSETVTTLELQGLALLAGAAIALPNRSERLFHIKDFIQYFTTTAVLTVITKNIFGRHRPSYTHESGGDDERKSFFSGHALTIASTFVYLGLYFHSNIFAKLREESQAFAWWEAFPLVAVAGVVASVSYSRVHDNRHPISDILVGAGVGSAMATSFYLYQEHNFYQHRARKGAARRPLLTLQPTRKGESCCQVGFRAQRPRVLERKAWR